MDNQPSLQPVQPVSYSQIAKQSKSSKIPKIICVVLVIAVIGALGYLLFSTHTTLTKTKNDLAAKQQALTSTEMALTTSRADLDKQNQAKDFITKYNNAARSRSDCSGQSEGMFDVHINDKYAVYRYLCANSSNPIRIGAFQKLQDGTWSFTYGDSSIKNNRLPDYIYNSEPDFFGPIYGATKF